MVKRSRRTCRSGRGKRYKCGCILVIVWKSWKTWFLALVGLTRVKGKSVRKQVTKKDWKGGDKATKFWSHFGAKSINIQFKTTLKKRSPRNMEFYAKWSQNVIQNCSKTHQKSMPKLVTKKIMKIIKNHVSLNGKIIEIHCKNKCFWWFRRLHVRTVKVSKKNIKSETNIHPQNRWIIDTNFMLEKGIPKTWKFIKQVIKKGGEQWATTRKKEKQCQHK